MRSATLLTPKPTVKEFPPAANAAGSGIPASPGRLSRVFRRALSAHLDHLRDGQIELIDGPYRKIAGQGGTGSLMATIRVHAPRAYGRALFGGSLGAAESYLDGDWDCDDLSTLLRIFARNLAPRTSLDGVLPALMRSTARWKHWLARNSRRGSRRNIELHYDLGDDFFRLFLDESMMYSSAIFEQETTSLEEAQLYRMDRICRKLALSPQDHVLEIGTGWGGFAVHAARNYGCRVTSTTISQNQFEAARQRVCRAGLQDRVTVLNQDYRDLRGRYDKLVSIEMIEAVGAQYFDTYFTQCGRLLRRGGRMLLQAIVIPDQRYQQYLRSVDFIQRYIFPGGCLPSISTMQQSIARCTDFTMTEIKDFAPHYARTLREWRARFHRHLPEVQQLGYSERFIRMWDYYLCYCEAAFEERAIGVVQAVWQQPGE